MHADESPAAELWRRTLSQIPTVFGRLVYLASLRDPNTGIYQHFGFAQRFTAKEADKTMRRSHANVFGDWLSFSIEEQKQDLDRYLAGLEGEKSIIVSNWSQFPPFANFMPPKIREADQELFLTDMKVNMELLKFECSAALSHPGASRRR